MPQIDIRRPHQLSIPEARTVVDKVAMKMREKFATESQWQGDTLKFARSGVNGTIAVGSDAVVVHAELGLMLSPMKGMIEQEIRRKLDEYFA
ncbi:polyhydroxyalkanoic acid system family protein [Rhodanobacter sp. MP1X3]|uniref:polyhydroxyalkanoic acid system family protein n=1 Tax=Rhodanobacter sp. MP1X3 TaxID=2723086 RepID=UPI00161A78F9|nr:polyhydroxyalkanoic acid system family protein [Rhodanobacter sp. MP1X3]MBB6244515.1 putative polyhydroxyalkanoate system protein [Rhodanobacter sp. MP1X3]